MRIISDQNMLPEDWREFIESLNSANANYVIVGGHAVAFHGYPRLTTDLDILVEPTPENAARVVKAIELFGFASLGIQQADLVKEDQIIQLGFRPARIDIATSISGVNFEEVWKSHVIGNLGELSVRYIGYDALIKNKRASGRPKDLVDVDEIERK
jgi:hypothetical protein